MVDVQPPSKFDLLVTQNELRPDVAKQLHRVLSTCEIVLLCDDLGLMKELIVEPGSNKRTTRWLELKKLASVIIEFVTAINPNGLDIYFFNQPNLKNITDMAGLQDVFSQPPSGSTPLIGTIKDLSPQGIFQMVDSCCVVITDRSPTDGSHTDIFNTLTNKSNNVHVSFAECTDREEDMAYLDRWDGYIRNFDNTDDDREEFGRVRRAQGALFKFDYTDYVINILLATFVRWYFNLDKQGSYPRDLSRDNILVLSSKRRFLVCTRKQYVNAIFTSCKVLLGPASPPGGTVSVVVLVRL